mmetsp:Transcript_1719/g.2053  ORF Transcript_1719/g.2053 Transcript_1719/m.2053 type:complete len:574 (+) Transcript_1719:18-1739(+)
MKFTLLFKELNSLELVKVLSKLRNSNLKTLTLTYGKNGLITLVTISERISSHRLPVIKRTLREGLSSSVGTKIGSESERLHNRQVGEESHLGCSRSLLLREYVTTTTGEYSVYVTHGFLGNGNITEVYRLKKVGVGGHQRSEAHTTGGRHDLSHTTVNGISMKYNIHQVETASTHLFLTEGSVLGSPGESSYNRLLNLHQVVHSLRGINEKIGSGSIRSEGPDLTCLGYIPSELISHLTSLNLLVSSGKNITFIDGKRKLGSNGVSLNKETVVLVGRLGKTGLVRLTLTSLTEGYDGIRNLNLSSHEIILKILKTNLKVKLSRGGDNVLSRLLGVTQNHRVRLGKTLHTLNKLGQIGRVLRLNGTTNNGGYREFHGLNGVGISLGTDGSGLEEVLINSYKGTSVSSGYISNLFGVTSHHNNGTLNVLNPELRLLARLVVRSHDAYLLSSGDLSREYTSEGVEASLVGGGNHLRNVHTKRSSIGGITSTDSSGGGVIQRSFVKGINTVGLGLGGRRKMKHNHLQNGVSGRKPLLHNTLKKLLSNKFLLFRLELNSNSLEHLLYLSVLLVHDGLE